MGITELRLEYLWLNFVFGQCDRVAEMTAVRGRESNFNYEVNFL